MQHVRPAPGTATLGPRRVVSTHSAGSCGIAPELLARCICLSPVKKTSYVYKNLKTHEHFQCSVFPLKLEDSA